MNKIDIDVASGVKWCLTLVLLKYRLVVLVQEEWLYCLCVGVVSVTQLPGPAQPIVLDFTKKGIQVHPSKSLCVCAYVCHVLWQAIPLESFLSGGLMQSESVYENVEMI